MELNFQDCNRKELHDKISYRSIKALNEFVCMSNNIFVIIIIATILSPGTFYLPNLCFLVLEPSGLTTSTSS